MRPAANPPSAQVATNEATIPDILRAINRHRLLIIAIIMAIMALAVMALGMVKPVYRAEAVLLIAPTETLSNDDVLHDVEVGDANAVIESQIRILGSSSLAGRGDQGGRSIGLDSGKRSPLGAVLGRTAF